MSNILPLGSNTALSHNSGSVIISHSTNAQFDINLSAFLLLNNDKVANDNGIVFFNQPNSENSAVQFITPVIYQNKIQHQLDFDLSRLPSGIYKIAVCLSEEQCIGLSALTQLKIEIKAINQTIEIKPESLNGLNSLIVAEIYLRNNQPKVKAICQGFNTGLEGLCRHYGVTVDNQASNSTDENNIPPPINSIDIKYYSSLIFAIVVFLGLITPIFSDIYEKFLLPEHISKWFLYWSLLKVLLSTILFIYFLSAIWRSHLNDLAQSWLPIDAVIVSRPINSNNEDDASCYYEGGFIDFIIDVALFCYCFIYFLKVDTLYRYSVDGQNYCNDNYSYVKNRFYFKRNRDRIAGLYPVNQNVRIYYNPNNPSMSVINRDSENLSTIVFKSNWLLTCFIATPVYSIIYLIVASKF